MTTTSEVQDGVKMVEEMHRLCDHMEQLLHDVEKEKKEKNDGGVPERKPGKKRKERKDVQNGDRVRVTVTGDTKGRYGTITGRRGTMFWWIRLEATPYEPERNVFKMRSSFKVVTG